MTFTARAPRHYPKHSSVMLELKPGAPPVSGRLINISASGCNVEIPSADIDRTHAVGVQFSGHGAPASTKAGVVRTRPIGNGFSSVHLQFHSPLDGPSIAALTGDTLWPDLSMLVPYETQAARLIDHADRMWNAEAQNSLRLEQRSRLLQTIAAGALAFLAFGVYRTGSSILSQPATGGGAASDIITAIRSSFQPPPLNPLEWDRVWLAAAALVGPLLTSIILVFAALANELRHYEDVFRYPPKQTISAVPRPQKTWKHLNILTVLGDAVCIAVEVIFPGKDRVKFRDTKYASSPGDHLADAYRDDSWMKPRPIIRRADMASFYLQFTAQGARDATKFLRSCSPPDALVFRSTYLAANSLRRWNQRKLDELRRSEALLTNGLIMAAIAAIVYVNCLLFGVEGYPVIYMLGAGVAFLAIACSFRCLTRSKSQREFESEMREFFNRSQEFRENDGDSGIPTPLTSR